MSNSGYRGRNFGPRGARTNGPANGFNGPRFPHPSFNHPRPPHRLPGPEKWIERPNYAPWQQTKTFHPPPQYRGNIQFRPNSRGRAAGGRGIVRFSSPGRSPAPQFCMGFVRNPIPRPVISQEEKPEATKSTAIPQPPLLGSEEERRQKISETADKLKQKLSSITEEELTNFWEDDLSVLPNSNGDEQKNRNKGIPVLRHGPPELDLTFTDFRDIGRVDCNNSKFEDVDSISNDEILISFEQKSADNVTSTNDEITIIHESREEPLTILDSPQDREGSDRSNLLLENDKCQEQMHHELSDFECSIENLQLQADNIAESPASSILNDPDGKSFASNLNQNIADLLPLESVNDLSAEKCLDANEIEVISVSACSSANDQDALQVEFPPNQSSAQLDAQDARRDISRDANVDVQRNDNAETKVLDDKQLQDNSQLNVCQEVRHPNPENLSDSTQQSRPFNPPNQEIHPNAVCDSTSPVYSNCNEIHKANDDKKLSNSTVFQPRVFNVPPRFAPRGGGGPRCRWTFQQNGKNSFFRGPQRLPFHGNRISPPRHLGSFKSTDLIPVGFDPRAPPPFSLNVPVSSHDSQHNKLVPFSTSDLPPAFDPSEPPPNIRPKSATEPPNIQENMQPMPALDSRGQPVNIAQTNLKVMQPPPVFSSRGPPSRMPNVSVASSEKLPEFNPQQPPPKIHKRDETLQPPPIFDPRLSSQERSNLIAPLDASRPNMMPLNLIETSPVADFNIGPVTPNFPQLPPPPINIPSHQPFMSNVQMNFQPILSRPNNEQGIMREFTLLPPSVSIAKVPPPPPKEPSIGGNSNPSQSLNMDDGLEDMQEAMEFAKQIMNMSEESKSESVTSSAFSELPLKPSEIPIPNETVVSRCSSVEEGLAAKKQKKKENKSKKGKSNVICGPELIAERQEELEAVDEEQTVQTPSKSNEELLSSDQIRPKVVFNLNSKTKKIHKTEEWHRTAVNVSENREPSQQSAASNSSKQRTHSRKYSSESKRSNANQTKEQQQQLEGSAKTSSSPSIAVPSSSSAHEKSNDASYRPKSYAKDSSKSKPRGISTPISRNASAAQKKSKKEGKKERTSTSESSWKNRVISRFLKMSKNDICNMVNNSSLRKFDIAMKHLVKERRSSLSLKMRNTEDEKMKEYDREEFMTQLNAMLDPSAVVGITDLPTEFIHHLSEVLHLDPMPFDLELAETHANANVDEVAIINQVETSKLRTSECSNEEDLRAESCVEYPEPRSVCEEHAADEFMYDKEESTRCPLNSDFSMNVSREDTNSSHRSLPNKLNADVESVHGKKQQPLFNEADLDDILSEVTERTRNLPSATSLAEPTEKATETPSFVQTVTEAFGYDHAFSEMPNRTAADLDDIFSAGIARVKLFGKSSSAEGGVSRTRKSNSEDRSTFRSDRYERWNRKVRDDPDTFRNLTKEEWEAKYASTNAATTTSFVARKSVLSSTENLSKDSSSRNSHAQRHCSSDSPTRNSSVSPLTCEFASAHDFDSRYPNEEEEARRERSGSSSETFSTSSSDTDEETVSPNVTKLLKVIKEKEKIAKKRSINETIRDEVAAEIEKKWKEKSKHKERKSRKREKRKKDKREKRRKEKRKRRRRNSYSNSSKSLEQMEGFRLLTEDEIKKEVVVKEEPVNSEENVSLGNGTNNTCGVSTSANSQVESQSSRLEKEQAPEGAVPCDTVSSQPKSKPVIVSTMQPKTKAQLKQMPENTEQRQVTEKATQVTEKAAQVTEKAAQVTGKAAQVTEKAAQVTGKAAQVTKNPVNTDSEKTRDASETSRDNEVVKNSSEAISPQQINVSLNVREAVSLNQVHMEGSDTSAARKTSLTSSASNSAGEVSSSNQAADQKVLASTSAAVAESKGGGYKKIDIKAYKERALQRRLKEQSTLMENSGNPAALIQEQRHALPASKSCEEELKTTGSDASDAQSKDLRLPRVRLSNISASEDYAREAKRKDDQKCTDAVQRSKECMIGVESKSCDEKNATRSVDCNSDILRDSVKCEEVRRSDCKSEELVLAKEKSKGVSEKKKSKKASADVESSKFKHIRSEGSKELKLKKEKARKSDEKKKRDSKSSLTEKHAERHSFKKVLEGTEESSNASTNTVVRIEIEKTCNRDNRDARDHPSNLEATPSQSGSNLESITDGKTAQKETNTRCTVEQKDQESTDRDKESMDTDKRVTSQTNEAIASDRSLVDEKPVVDQVTEDSTVCSRKTSLSRQSEPISIAPECKGLVKSEDGAEETGAEIKKEATKKDGDGCLENSNRQEDVSCKQIDPSISVERCAKSAPSDYVVEELHLLSERIDVDIEKSGTMINIKNLKSIGAHNNSTVAQIDVIAVVKDDDSNMETNDMKRKEKFASHLYEKLKNQSRSPDSPSSPFKGFLADSIDEDICQVSQLYDSKVNNVANEGNSGEDSNKCSKEPRMGDKLAEERASSDKDVLEKTEEDNAAAPVGNSAEEQSNVTDKTIDDNLNAVDNVKVGSTMEEGDVSENNDEACNNDVAKQEKALSVGDMDSRDIFDENNEPFIVLDEYIDDGDGKSIEKLSNLDLDLEECIARDADIFASKCLREEKEDTTDNAKSAYFSSVDFKELSEFDKDTVDGEENQNTVTAVNEKEECALSEENIVLSTDLLVSREKSAKATTDVVSSTSESNIEATSKIPKSIDSTVSEIPVEASQNVISTTSKDIASQRSATPESSATEKRRNEEEETRYCGDVAENNLQVANEILSMVSDVTKPATETSLKNFLVSTRETKVEFLKLNKQQESEGNERPSIPSQTKTSADKGNDSNVENETVKRLTKSSERERNDALRKIKNKSRMKHKKRKRDISGKMVKEAIKSDTVKMKCPNTKEAIMARMIEIDVEIHKLMTEKMTLYQMLTSDAISSDNNLQQNNVIHEENRVETPVHRPRTPSALMSQLIQNIETSPVADQRGKLTAEALSGKGSPTNSLRSNKPKGFFKHDHRAEKKGSCTSTCGSDDDEIVQRVVGAKSVSRKRKRQSFEKATKRLELELANASNRDMQTVAGEKKQANDATRLPAKKATARQPPTEQDFNQLAEAKFQHDIGKLSVQQTDKIDSINDDKGVQFKCKESEKIVEPAEFRMSREEIVRGKIRELNEERYSRKMSEDRNGRLNEKNAHVNSLEKSVEGKMSERSSIYSDDSTWDSLLHGSSVEEQKKQNTGLALLEETYRKEMAKTRKVKAAARKKKKKKLQNMLETVHVLTPDEEELPLSTLYVKKLHQKRKLLSSLEQHAKQQADEDPRLWKNVVEVINAVAENRAGNVYVESLDERSAADSERLVSGVSRLGENDESKEDAENKEEHRIDSSTVRKIKEVCVALCADVKERKDAANSNPKGKDLHSLSGKSQEYLSNEYFQQDLEVNVSSQTSKDPCDTSTSVAKSCAQQPVETDNLEGNQLALIGDSDSCLTEASLSNTQNDRNASSVAENTEKNEERTSSEEKVADIEKNSEEPARSESVITSVDVERSSDNSMEFNSDKNTGTINAFTSEEDPDSKLEGPSDGKLPDSSVPCEREKTVDKTMMEGSKTCASQAEHKRKEVERFDKTSSEENNNQNCTSVSSFDESADASKSDESFVKKSQKRKRGSSKTPLRRSSRYAEEPAKRVKVEADLSSTELEAQEKNLGTQFPSISSTSLSSCEEVETIWMNHKKSRNVQKAVNRKRCTPAEIEVLYSSSESLKGGKRHKQHTVSEMMNCVVKVVDCKRTLLNQNANPCALQKCGVFRVNTSAYPNNSSQEDSFVSSMQSTSTKDSLTVCAKQSMATITTTLTEHPQSQASKLTTKRPVDPVNDQLNFTKAKNTLKPAKVDSPMNDRDDCVVDPDIEVMPVLTKEPVTVDITHPCEKPDIEIVVEKMIVTKNQQQQHGNCESTLTVIDTKDDKELPRTQYTVHKGPILDIKVFENSFLAASEDGRIYRYNQASNGILNIYKGHTAAVTCLYVYNATCTDIIKEWMFSGSLDGTLRCYNITTGVQVRDTADIGSPIQCMDEAWGIIFIGTKSGHVSRYHMKSGTIKGNTIQFSDKSVLALKATNEGPRRVLIVASRSQPITIRDAQNGLFLRTICGQKNHTVYSLMHDNNLIYCGTSSTSIPVFDFTNGEQTMQYNAGVGIVCMRLYKQLVFAGCYDGNIYVFDTKDHRLVCSIPGPGNMLLSMEIIDNKIIAGSKDKRLQSWQMPRQVRSLL